MNERIASLCCTRTLLIYARAGEFLCSRGYIIYIHSTAATYLSLSSLDVFNAASIFFPPTFPLVCACAFWNLSEAAVRSFFFSFFFFLFLWYRYTRVVVLLLTSDFGKVRSWARVLTTGAKLDFWQLLGLSSYSLLIMMLIMMMILFTVLLSTIGYLCEAATTTTSTSGNVPSCTEGFDCRRRPG